MDVISFLYQHCFGRNYIVYCYCFHLFVIKIHSSQSIFIFAVQTNQTVTKKCVSGNLPSVKQSRLGD
jgi:hypothetical protein